MAEGRTVSLLYLQGQEIRMPERWPALLTLDQVVEIARATMVCTTCALAIVADDGEPCPEQKYVRGCIHWKRRIG
jgi:hypothetical protein